MPMPPASDTAATSSGLLQGYIAPQMSGISMPAWRVSAVAPTGSGIRHRLEPPHHRGPGHHLAGAVLDVRGDLVVGPLGHHRNHDPALTGQSAARLLEVFHRDAGDDAADGGWKSHQHREAAGQLAQVEERHRVDRAEMVAHAAAVAEFDPGVAGLELPHRRTDRAAVRDHGAEDPAEDPLAAREWGEPGPEPGEAHT